MRQNNIQDKEKHTTEWVLSNFIENPQKDISIKGKPGLLKCKYGYAVTFDGSADAIFIESMPITGLDQFTVEMIFNPSSGGNFEQRFLHLGEILDDRVLLELRSTESGWYFDGFIKLGDLGCTLIEPSLIHPSDQWYHVAYVIDQGKIATYVNSKKELEGQIVMTSLKSGKTSIGVRQNEVSWFKGAIYNVKITGKALKPVDFMSY